MKIKSKIWIEDNEGKTIISYGKYLLLKEISKTHSLSESASNLGLSFRKAWIMIKTMNERAGTPLVITKKGGAGGGGETFLTPEGEKLIQFFEILNREVEHLTGSFEKVIWDNLPSNPEKE